MHSNAYSLPASSRSYLIQCIPTRIPYLFPISRPLLDIPSFTASRCALSRPYVAPSVYVYSYYPGRITLTLIARLAPLRNRFTSTSRSCARRASRSPSGAHSALCTADPAAAAAPPRRPRTRRWGGGGQPTARPRTLSVGQRRAWRSATLCTRCARATHACPRCCCSISSRPGALRCACHPTMESQGPLSGPSLAHIWPPI